MNSSNIKNKQTINPCNIKYEDYANSYTDCRTIGIGWICEKHITTQAGDRYKRYDGITHYHMTDKSTGMMTNCPYGWWERWTTRDDK